MSEQPDEIINIEGRFIFRGPHLFPGHIETPPNIVAINVKKVITGNTYHHTFSIEGGDGTEYKSHYPWAFVVIDETNLEKYAHFLELSKISEEASRKCKLALRALTTLENKEPIDDDDDLTELCDG